MLLKCECNYKDTINYGIRWIVSYMRIFVERFIVVYAFYPKKKNRAHARLWNIKKWNVKAYEFQFRIISLCFEFWCRKYITGHNAKPKWFRCRYIIKFECLAICQVQNWVLNLQYLTYFSFRWHVWWENSRIPKRLNCWKASNWRACYRK